MRVAPFVLSVLFSASPYLPAYAGKLPSRYQRFVLSARKCLATPTQTCLETLVPQKMYFPQQTDFGCRTADSQHHWYITPKEFAECALTSEQKHSATPSLTLMEALKICFAEGAQFNSDHFEPKNGYACHLETEGPPKLTSVSPGC